MNRRLQQIIFIILVAVFCIGISAQEIKVYSSPEKILSDKNFKAIVLLFVRTDCPVSNRYAPEMKRLIEKFSARQLKFYLIYPGADESAEAIKKHLADYGYTIDVWHDPKHLLVKTAGVQVTPEAAVFVNGKILYRGRIDDQVVAFGKTRPAPLTRDLEQVLDAIERGKIVRKKTTTAIGCFIN